jgi:hypothetical protein
VTTVVPRGGSPIPAALPAAHGALDERLLVGTDVSALSALAGARVGTVGVTLRTKKNTKLSTSPLKSGVYGESATYLK